MRKRSETLLTLVMALCVIQAAAAQPATPFAFADYLLAPVRIHLLSADTSEAIHTTLTEQDVDRILRKINSIWAQAGIHFYRESLVREEAINQELGVRVGAPGDLRLLLSLRPEATRDPRMFHLYYIKRMSANGVYLGEAMFVKDTAALREVPGGIDEPLPRVSSHELGHALTLVHQTDSTHLMARGTTGFQLGEDEIRQAREAAAKFDWIESAPTVIKRAESLRSAGNEREANVWLERVHALPGDGQEPRPGVGAPGLGLTP